MQSIVLEEEEEISIFACVILLLKEWDIYQIILSNQRDVIELIELLGTSRFRNRSISIRRDTRIDDFR